MSEVDRGKDRLEYVISFALYLLISISYNLISNRGALFGLKGGDAFLQSFPLKMYQSIEGIKSLFLWLPEQFLGIPFLGLLHPGLLYPFNLLYAIFDPYLSFTISDLIHPALTGLFTFMCGKIYGLRFLPAFLSGACFAFSGFVMAHRGHTSMVHAVTYFPLLVYLYERLKREQKAKWSILAGIVTGLQILAGHMQIVVYSYVFLLIFTAYNVTSVPKGTRVKFLSLSLFPALLGAILSLPQLYSTFELSRYSFKITGDYNYFTEYSFPPFMIFQLILPFIYGGGYGRDYWGALNLTEMAGFIGVFPLVTGLWALVRLWGKESTVRFLGLVLIICFFLALGRFNPFYKLLYYVPVYNLFRCSARHWMEIDFALSILFGFGLNYLLFDPEGSKKRKEIMIGLGLALLITYTLVLVGRSFSVSLAISDAGRALIRRTFSFNNKAILIPSGFIVAYTLVWFLYMKLADTKRRLAGLVLVGIVGLSLAEFFSFGVYHEPNVGKDGVQRYLKDPALTFLRDKAKFERCLFVRENADHVIPLYTLVHRVSMLNGYEPFVPLSVFELLEIGANGISGNYSGLLFGNLLLSSLNARYVAVHRSSLEKYKGIEDLALLPGTPEMAEYHLGRWELFGAEELEDGSILLKSRDGKRVSQIEQTLKIKPGTTYLLSFEVRSPTADPVVLDLFGGPSYDSGEQELIYRGPSVNGEYTMAARLINSGPKVPENVKIRVFTYSPHPVYVRNVKLAEVRGIPAIGENGKFAGGRAYKKVYETQEWVIYENKNCLPRAFCVSRLEKFRGIADLKRRFDSFSLDPSKVAFVDDTDFERLGGKAFTRGTVEIESYDSNRIVIRCRIDSAEGFLVLSDFFYPGWKAFIDGKETKIYRVNGLLRGIVVDAGSHQVEFKYEPSSLKYLLWLSLACFFLCAGYSVFEFHKGTGPKEL